MAAQVIHAAKMCTKCGIAKPNDFSSYFRDHRNGGFLSICRECMKARRKAAYRRDIIMPREAAREVVPATHKRCRNCKELLVLASFYPSGECRQGVRPECKKCTIVQQQQSYFLKTEGRRRVRRTPYEAGDLRECGTCHALKSADTEHFPHKPGAKINLSSRCRDCTRAASLQLSKRPDQKAKRRIIKLNRQAGLRGASGFVSANDIDRMRAAQKNKCWWCQKTLTAHHVDHRFPIKYGGEHKLSNLVLSCPRCNLRKQAKMPWEIDNPRLL